MENKTLSWTAGEFVSHKKSFWWYLGFLIVTAGLLAYAWYSHNILTLVTFVIICFLAFLFSHIHPRQITYRLTSTGIVTGSVQFPYRNIKKFWIIYTAENKTLNIETTA